MPLNHYFNNYDAKYREERLVEDLIVESIKIMGIDCFYLPNTNNVARDLIYGEDPLKTFTAAYPIEIYPENVMNYGGQQEFFSKFGLEIRANLTVCLSRRTFNQRVSSDPTFSRPREGDLIFVPMLNGQGELFEIRFVNQNKDMAMLGRHNPYFFEMELEKFKYSHETISTGIPDIDIIQQDEAYQEGYIMTSVTGRFQVGEVVFQSPDSTFANATTTATISDYNYITNAIDVNHIMAVTHNFVLGNTLHGYTSNATGTLTSTDQYAQKQNHIEYDNKLIETEANTFLNFTETNPFGQI